MTGLDLLAYWLGYGVLILIALAFLVGAGMLLLELSFRPLFLRMIGVYDLYVLHWWLDRIKASGHVIPTRKAVRDVLDNLDDE